MDTVKKNWNKTFSRYESRLVLKRKLSFTPCLKGGSLRRDLYSDGDWHNFVTDGRVVLHSISKGRKVYKVVGGTFVIRWYYYRNKTTHRYQGEICGGVSEIHHTSEANIFEILRILEKGYQVPAG